MDRCFKIALWMFFLIGYLQAHPVSKRSVCSGQVNMGDLGCSYLRKDVSCGNVTFTSPTNVKETCHHAAFKHFEKELIRARTHCEDGNDRINDTLETLVEKVLPCVQVQKPNSPCKLETQTFQFERFVNETEDWVKSVNTQPIKSGN